MASKPFLRTSEESDARSALTCVPPAFATTNDLITSGFRMDDGLRTTIAPGRPRLLQGLFQRSSPGSPGSSGASVIISLIECPRRASTSGSTKHGSQSLPKCGSKTFGLPRTGGPDNHQGRKHALITPPCSGTLLRDVPSPSTSRVRVATSSLRSTNRSLALRAFLLVRPSIRMVCCHGIAWVVPPTQTVTRVCEWLTCRPAQTLLPDAQRKHTR